MSSMGKVHLVSASAVVALVCLSGCETIRDTFSHKDPVDSSVVATWWDGPRIRPGIQLVIQVSTMAATPVTMTVLVDQSGDITLPHLLQEPVPCDGLTLEALKQKLVKLYSKYYKLPKVAVTFAPYDGKGVSPWGTVTVLGEVGNPGPVNMPATMDLTVTKVLQAAGRVIRTEKDQGIVALLDERFLDYSYQRLFPREWQGYSVTNVSGIGNAVSAFWETV